MSDNYGTKHKFSLIGNYFQNENKSLKFQFYTKKQLSCLTDIFKAVEKKLCKHVEKSI